jgi:predicted Ser/Thr protein kinase
VGGPPDDVPPSHHARVKQIFLDALDVPRGRRAAFLAGACAGDEPLQREVLELFLLHGEQDSVLDAPLDGGDALAELVTPTGGWVGAWRLVRELGRGGMGVVYLAEFGSGDGRPAAVKQLAAGAVSPEVRERFRLEAEILGRLHHPGIARVLDAGEMTGPGGVPLPWIAMEYVDGRPLQEYATAAGLGLEARIALLAAVCDAVQHAHTHGIVHRDLKPSNILVRADGRPVVVDFGVARLLSGDERPTELATRTGQLVGTPQYMSPEQVQAEPAGIGPASDVYSLGIIAYELFAGRLPYEASSVSLHRAIVSILTSEPPPLGREAPALRGSLERIVAMALEKDPRERYPDAGSLGDDLRRRLEGRTVRARGPGLVRRVQRWSRGRRRLVAGTALVLLAFLLVAAWGIGAGRGLPRERVLATYREAETLINQGVPLLYEGERTPVRLEQAIELYTRARSLLGQVPPLRHEPLLVRRLEKDLGTAQFLLGELTWDTSPYRASIVTLEHARTVSRDTVAGWAADRQVTELGSLDTPQVELTSLLAAAELGLYRLWGESNQMDNAEREAHSALAQTIRESGLPRALSARSERESAADPFVYRYNALAEITTERARFAWNPDLAREAVLYSDSAYARRVALEQNWPALGSVLFERGRAFRTLGELSGSVPALDSSGSYLRACADFRGPNRPWVFAQTEEELARLLLARARLEPNGRAALLKGARAEVDSAVAALAATGLPPAARASLRSLDGELLIELARAERRPALLDSAGARLTEASRAFPTTAYPRHAAIVWVREALLSRARYEFDGKRERLDAAIEALDRARMLSQSRSDRLLMGWVQGERTATQRLAAAGR